MRHLNQLWGASIDVLSARKCYSVDVLECRIVEVQKCSSAYAYHALSFPHFLPSPSNPKPPFFLTHPPLSLSLCQAGALKRLKTTCSSPLWHCASNMTKYRSSIIELLHPLPPSQHCFPPPLIRPSPPSSHSDLSSNLLFGSVPATVTQLPRLQFL